MRLIERNLYLQKLQGAVGSRGIKVVTAVRRSGKYKLMELFMAWARKNVQDESTTYIDFSMNEVENLKKYHALEEVIRKSHLPGKKNFVVVDEAQMCQETEKAIAAFMHLKNTTLHTGSNVFLLSGDLATFAGRTFAIEISPSSFAKLTGYFGLSDPHRALSRCIREEVWPDLTCRL